MFNRLQSLDKMTGSKDGLHYWYTFYMLRSEKLLRNTSDSVIGRMGVFA